MTRRLADFGRGSRSAGAVVMLWGAAHAAMAHGAQPPRPAWLEGVRSLFGDPASVLVLLVMALLIAQPGQPRMKPALLGGLAGLAVGTLPAAAGLVVDPTLPLLALALAIGGLVAWARPWPPWLHAALAAAVAAGVVLVQVPAEAPSLAYRLAWLAGVIGAIALLFGNTLGAVLALLGRRPGPVRRMLLRVAGSWIATAALLVLVLEGVRRSA